MKLMIASDIHGSSTYCAQLLDAFDREKPDKLLLLGDLLYHGPRNALPHAYDPQKVASMLNNYKQHLLCVRGNCEAEVDQLMLEFPVLADYAMLLWQGKTVFATHGHLFSDTALPPLSAGDFLLCGHTHIPAWKEINGIIYLNPGSVSIPKENSHHGYMIFNQTEVLWKDLSGTVIRMEALF